MLTDYVNLLDHYSLFLLFHHLPLRIIHTSAIKGNIPVTCVLLFNI